MAERPSVDACGSRRGRHDDVVSGRRLHRYEHGARCYDVLSLERPLYRAGRVQGISTCSAEPASTCRPSSLRASRSTRRCSHTRCPSSVAGAQALEKVRSGGRIAVVDMMLPTGRWRVLSPLARLACLAGGADTDLAAWTVLLEATEDTSQ